MASRAMRAPRLALSSFRQPARRYVSAQQGPKAKAGSSDLPWMVGSAAVFGPTLFYLLGPNAPGKHESHDDHEDHKDAGRGVYSRTSREPKWSEEDEELDRLRHKANGDDEDEEEAEEGSGGEESGSEDDSDGPATPADSDHEEEGGNEEGEGEKKGRPLQSDVQSSKPNRTPRNADPDKLRFAAQHYQQSHESGESIDPKKMIEDMREKKKQGDTAGEEMMRGDRTDATSGDDALSDRAKAARAKDKAE